MKRNDASGDFRSLHEIHPHRLNKLIQKKFSVLKPKRVRPRAVLFVSIKKCKCKEAGEASEHFEE